MYINFDSIEYDTIFVHLKRDGVIVFGISNTELNILQKTFSITIEPEMDNYKTLYIT